MNSERPRAKNYIGMGLLILGLTLYSFAAAAIGELLTGTHTAIQVIFYMLAGIVWIFPAYKLLSWMAKS